MQVVEARALQKYEEICNASGQFVSQKQSEDELKHQRFVSKWRKRYDLFYFIILLVSDPQSYESMLELTAEQIIDLYLARQL